MPISKVDVVVVGAGAAGLAAARTVMEQITREVRQGSQVFVGSATQLSLITYVDKASCGGETATTAIQCRVDYSCVSGACVRLREFSHAAYSASETA